VLEAQPGASPVDPVRESDSNTPLSLLRGGISRRVRPDATASADTAPAPTPAVAAALAYVDPIRLAWLAADRSQIPSELPGSGAELDHESYDTTALLAGPSSSPTRRGIGDPSLSAPLERLRAL
jgi:hypothetical protein